MEYEKDTPLHSLYYYYWLMLAATASATSEQLMGTTHRQKCDQYASLFVPKQKKAWDMCMKYEEFANVHSDKRELCIRDNRTTSPHAGDAVRTYINCLSYQKATYDRTNTPEYVAMQKELAATVEFVKNSGAEKILYADSEFRSNPYQYKNKVLALIGSWGQAISDTEVNLNHILISNVPAENVGSGHCMVIVKVLGSKEINLLGNVIVPNVEFRQQRCNIPWEVLIEAASNRS